MTILPKLTPSNLWRFNRIYATDIACHQGMLTFPDTWSYPTLGVACVLICWGISLPNLSVVSGLWVSNFYFAYQEMLNSCISYLYMPSCFLYGQLHTKAAVKLKYILFCFHWDFDSVERSESTVWNSRRFRQRRTPTYTDTQTILNSCLLSFYSMIQNTNKSCEKRGNQIKIATFSESQ